MSDDVWIGVPIWTPVIVTTEEPEIDWTAAIEPEEAPFATNVDRSMTPSLPPRGAM